MNGYYQKFIDEIHEIMDGVKLADGKAVVREGKALADGGVACGLPRHQATEYAAQMVKGTAQYILEKGIHPDALKDMVTSPGGTTIQGVRTLEKHGFRSALFEAVIATVEKDQQL